MNFRASFRDPFKPYVIELGDIEQDKIIEQFKKIPWAELLKKMIGKKEDDIHSSPTIEIENKDTKNTLTLSAVGTPDNFEYFIFYKRPKKVKYFFGLSEKIKENYLTETSKQTHQDAINCLNAFIKNDLDFLETKIK
jgi:hypothetical protein